MCHLFAALAHALYNIQDTVNFILVWLTCQIPAVGGLIVCECVSQSVCPNTGTRNAILVCPKTCRHIVRRMMNGCLLNFACMLGKRFIVYYLRCFADMALYSRDAVTVSAAVATRSRADYSSMEGHTSLSTALVLRRFENTETLAQYIYSSDHQ